MQERRTPFHDPRPMAAPVLAAMLLVFAAAGAAAAEGDEDSPGLFSGARLLDRTGNPVDVEAALQRSRGGVAGGGGAVRRPAGVSNGLLLALKL